MEVDTVITLDNDVNCLLLEKINYNNNSYFLANILNEEEEPSDESIIFKEIIENDENYVEKVEDEALAHDLLKLFAESIEKSVDELPNE